MIHNMEITSSGTHHKVVIDGVDVSDKVSRLFMSIDPNGLPEVHLICTPMKIAIEADDVRIVEHTYELKTQQEEIEQLKQEKDDAVNEIKKEQELNAPSEPIGDYLTSEVINFNYQLGYQEGLQKAIDIINRPTK